MRRHRKATVLALTLAIVGMVAGARAMQAPGTGATSSPPSSYMSVIEEPFSKVLARMSAAKEAIMKRQMAS